MPAGNRMVTNVQGLKVSQQNCNYGYQLDKTTLETGWIKKDIIKIDLFLHL